MAIHEPQHPSIHKKTPNALMDKHETRQHVFMFVHDPSTHPRRVMDKHEHMALVSCLSMMAGVFI
jgi:hypothetical protein